MNDLISRNELINVLKVHFDSCFREDGELLYSDHVYTSDDVIDLIKLVENEPTAYSVDKVVEELKAIKEAALVEYNMGEYNLDNNIGNSIAENYRNDMNEGRCFAYDDAIKIVKHGGVSDDVCECRRLNGYNFLYKTSCSNIFDMENGFKFCPYCGKKIKVIE